MPDRVGWALTGGSLSHTAAGASSGCTSFYRIEPSSATKLVKSGGRKWSSEQPAFKTMQPSGFYSIKHLCKAGQKQYTEGLWHIKGSWKRVPCSPGRPLNFKYVGAHLATPGFRHLCCVVMRFAVRARVSLKERQASRSLAGFSTWWGKRLPS